jgi:hypothetical protein
MIILEFLGIEETLQCFDVGSHGGWGAAMMLVLGKGPSSVFL